MDKHSPSNAVGNVAQTNGYTLVKTLPEPERAKVPEHMPARVRNLFEQAEMVRIQGIIDGSAMLYRSALETALKEIDNSIGDVPLSARINRLAQAGRLTEALKDWAHQIRLDGNDAAHDAQALELEDVERLADFARLVMTYLFTLPKEVEIARARRQAR